MIRARRSQPRRHERRAVTTISLAAGLTLAMVALVYVALTAPNQLPFTSPYVLHARFSQAGGLVNHDDIRVAGRRVGQVIEMRVQQGVPVADLHLTRSIAPLRSDTTLRVRSQGLLGARYLEVVPGRRGRRLPSGGWLAVSQTSATVEIPTLLSTFTPATRADLSATIKNLGRGTLGQGQNLNGAIAQAPRVLQDFGATAAAVLARPGAAARFVPTAAAAATAADPARDDLAAGFTPEADALRPFTTQRGPLQATLSVAPAALTTVRAGLSQTDPLLTQAQGLAGAATAMLRPAPAALAQVRALLASAPGPLRKADLLLGTVPSTVPAVVHLSEVGAPELPRLRGALRSSVPPLQALAPYSCDVLAWASNWANMVTFGVPGGGAIGPLNTLRLELIADPSTLGGGAGNLQPNKIQYPAPCTTRKSS